MRGSEPVRPLSRATHRSLGILAACLLFWLALTGIPLQFTAGLELGKRFVANPAILELYGIPAPAAGWRSGDAVLIGDTLFYERQPLTVAHRLTGTASFAGFTVIGLEDRLLVISSTDTDAREALPVPQGIQRLGKESESIWLESGNGRFLTLDEDLDLQAVDSPAGTIRWSTVAPLVDDDLTEFSNMARGRVLTMERFLQDLHSGRALGTAGEWLINLGALALTIMAGTGLWIWWKTR